MIFERYNKENMERFAITVVAKSFDASYSEFIQPLNADNFDHVSPNGLHALEVVSVIPENEIRAYVYEKLLSAGKTELNTSDIKWAKFKDDGFLQSYYGGSIDEITKAINDALKTKYKKAAKRMGTFNYDTVDLCVCIKDGGLMDIYSFTSADLDLNSNVFNNIFFVTQSCFFRYSRNTGFEEYVRKV